MPPSRPHIRVIAAAAFAALWLIAGDAAARSRGAPPPTPVKSGLAVSIVDGDTLVLKGGVEVRLVGIQAPKLPLGRRSFKAWPLAPEAKAVLSRLTLGKQLALWYGGRKSDRHGRLLAHLTTPEGKWVQGELLGAGMARVYSFPDNRARVDEMLALERAARDGRRGIWAHRYYRILTPDSLALHIGTFQIVEARVLAVALVRGRAYLNFGPDWRTDFTVSIARGKLRRGWRGADPGKLYKGKRLRVRGWLKSFNGPMIEATHPEQIELLP
ncbi:MAG: thermonuclease family protein [Alphaproteobacteria bacterium]